MSRFVSSLAALALLILLDGFAQSRFMAWHHGATEMKTRLSHRRLKDELLSDAVHSVDLRYFPEIPNLLRAPSCPGDWQHVLSLTYWLVAVLFGCCVFIVSFVIILCVAACINKHTSFFCRPSECAQLSVLLLLLLMACVVSWRFSGQLCEILPTKFQWHIYLPAHWQQVLRCHYLSFIRVPADVLPKNAGAALSTEDQSARLQFYGSLLILIVLAAFGIGKLLTLGASICKMAAARCTRDTYKELKTEDSSEVPPQQHHTPLWAHMSLHFFCAALALLAADFGLLSIQCGVCWEIYILWLLVMLIAGMLQAFHGLVHLPSDADVPDLGNPIVTPVLPILGEPLDIFKDWLFVALAVSQRTWLSFIIATLAALVLVFSSFWMRQYHCVALQEMLQPVSHAFCRRQQETFLAKHTAPSKLAVATSEDLPQAMLQSLFVIIYGGSNTQFVFIGISCAKIAMCILLREYALASSERWAGSLDELGRHQEALELKQRVVAARLEVRGAKHRDTLRSQDNCAFTLGELGRHQEALELQQQVVAGGLEVLGAKHTETLRSQDNLASTLNKLGRHQEALELQQQVVAARSEVFGAKHPETLRSKNILATSLDELGRHQEALEPKQQVVAASLEVLGAKHPDTLNSKNNLAVSLDKLGRQMEALELKEQVVVARVEVLGPKHPDTLLSINNLAISLGELGRHPEALEFHRQVVALRLEVLGAKHPDTLRSQDNLAFTWDELGRHQEALELQQQVVAARLEVLGAKHPETLRSQNNLANSLERLGRDQEALELRQQVVAARLEVLGAKHPDTLKSQNILATSLDELGRHQEALELQQQVVAARLEVLGAKHPDTLRSQDNLVFTLDELGRHQEALELQQEVAAARSKVEGQREPDP